MKLHLPKALFTAVLAGATAAYADTGWEGNTFYVGGDQAGHLDNSINTGYSVTPDDEETPDVDERVTTIEVVDATGKTGTLKLWADDRDSNYAPTNALIQELNVATDTTIEVGTNSWGNDRIFDKLTIDQISVTDGGTTNLNIQHAGHKVVIDEINGTVNEVTATGEVTLTGSSTTIAGKLYSNGGNITLGNGTDAGMTTVNRVEVGDNINNGSSSLNIESGHTLKVTGSTNGGDYKTNSIQVSEWNHTTTMNVKGTVLAENAAVLTGDKAAIINVENGGTLATKGLARAKTGKTGASTLNLKEGGKLVLGDMGINFGGQLSSDISGGTIGIAAESVTISEALNITGNLAVDTTQYAYGETGLTQGTTGGRLILSGNLTGNGSISATGAGTLELGAIDSSVSISAGSASTIFTGTLSMAEGAVFTANGGSYTLSTADLANFSVGSSSLLVDSEGNSATNGFASGGKAVISGGTITGEFTVEYDGVSYTINDANRTFGPADSIDLGTWYITSGSSTLSEVYAQSASASISAAAGTTLNVDTALAEGAGIELTGNAQLNISANQSISAGKVATNGHTVGLNGSGTYTINSGNATAVSIADTWTGTVELFGQSNAGLDLTNYGRSGSTISIKEYTGYFVNDQNATKNIDANLVLTNTTLAAVELTNGYSGCTYKFNGSISGGGNFIINKNLNGGKMTLNFAGDTSNWTGNMEVISGEHNVKFTNTATIANANIRTRKEDGATMNLTIAHDSAAVTVNSTITQEAGAVKLTANATEGVTFKKGVTVSSTTLGAGTTATFEAASDLGNLSLGAGASVTATSDLTLGALTLDLQSYTTDFTNTHTLVSTTGTLNFTGDLSSYQGVMVGEYTATVERTGSSILLTFASQPSEPDSFIVTGASGCVDGMLTLDVAADLMNYDFTNDGAIVIPGISDSIMKDILGLANLPEDGMVGITLQGTDGGTLSATADQQIGFLGKDGVSVYFGENVGSGWQYQVNYIPEPTTATLSLLALAGLAARRRRKA